MFKNIVKTTVKNAKVTPTSVYSIPSSAINTLDNGVFFKHMPVNRRVSTIGVPLEFGQPLAGVSKAPLEFRATDLKERIEREGWLFQDCGDVEIPTMDPAERERVLKITKKHPNDPVIKFADVVSESNRRTAEAVYARAKEGDFVLTIGGDHSIAIGSIAGILKHRPNTGIIWVDAHGDINTPYTSGSGNIHGMVLSFLMKFPESKVPEYAWLDEYPKLDMNRIVYIGLRDVDAGEKKILKENNIKCFTMHDVDRYGIGKVMDKAIDYLRNRTDNPIHLSFDIDGVDPLFAPSTGTRVGGGLTRREAYYICESIAQTGLLTSMDIVEVNTALASEAGAKDTVDLAKGLVVAALGDSIL